MKSFRVLAGFAALLLTASLAAAQQPNFTNAKVETRAVSGSLDSTISSVASSESSPLWVAYGVAHDSVARWRASPDVLLVPLRWRLVK